MHLNFLVFTLCAASSAVSQYQGCGSYNHTIGSGQKESNPPIGPPGGGRFKRSQPIVAGGRPGIRDFSRFGGFASVSTGYPSNRYTPNYSYQPPRYNVGNRGYSNYGYRPNNRGSIWNFFGRSLSVKAPNPPPYQPLTPPKNDKSESYKTVDSIYEQTTESKDSFASYSPDGIDNNPVPSEESNSASLQFFCGASLLSDQHLLTAAHCVADLQKEPLKVTFRDVPDENDPDRFLPITYDIESVIIHPDYNKDSEVRYHDLAIMKTQKKIKFTRFTWPYCLPQPGVALDTKILTVSGFGKVNLTHVSESLREAEVPVVPNNVCEKDYRKLSLNEDLKELYPQGFTNDLICAGKAGVGACEGDNGGPLTYHDEDGREVLVGVVSVGLACQDHSRVPGIYINVVRYADWINNILNE